MTTLRLVLGDQLTRQLSSLRDLDPAQDVVLMVEVQAEATYVPHHQQKLTFIFSAMRHFASALRAEGLRVDYVRLDEPGNTGNFTDELSRAVQRHGIQRVVVTEPGEWRVWRLMQNWSAALGMPVDIRDDDRFLCSRAEFAAWAGVRRGLRMEFFYREMRRRGGWLMNGAKPEGGEWNYDAENRQRLPKHHVQPSRLRLGPDAITLEVMTLVRERFGHHFGELESFNWAVTRADALRVLRHFIDTCLPRFGDYQDAMQVDEDFLYHSLLSPYLNVGLLTAREVCEAALQAWRAQTAPLNAAEGFIRQIIGWREYIRGVYWLYMPQYAQGNFFNARRKLPAFYWTAVTDMNCLRQCISSTRRHAYAHHIQRLMITGNFALLAGIEPRQVEEWYLLVYADAFEWVELPNTHGMALFADGGELASKPYAASGAYIQRMSNYCAKCAYSVKLKTGARACPFNYLYWNFLLEHQDKLAGNPRLAMPYRTLRTMSVTRQQQIRADARSFLELLD